MNLIEGIGLFIGIVGILVAWRGLYFAKKSFSEAKQAKVAATSAGQVVKRQSMAMEILEICYICKLDINITLPEARNRYMTINNRIRSIIGLYAQRPDSNCKDILEKIELKSASIKTQLNTFNPNDLGAGGENFIYYQLTDFFEALAGDLNELKGILEGQLIGNN